MITRLLICALCLCPTALLANAPEAQSLSDKLKSYVSAQSFSCSKRKTCGQMRSCAEACYYLITCGDRRRDGDNDGIPCEKICRGRC